MVGINVVFFVLQGSLRSKRFWDNTLKYHNGPRLLPLEGLFLRIEWWGPWEQHVQWFLFLVLVLGRRTAPRYGKGFQNVGKQHDIHLKNKCTQMLNQSAVFSSVSKGGDVTQKHQDVFVMHAMIHIGTFSIRVSIGSKDR